MLKGIIGVMREGMGLCRDNPLARAAIQKQLKHLEERLLIIEMKFALEASNYVRAAEYLQDLRRMKGGALLAAAAGVSRVCPVALGVAARLRAAFRENSVRSRAVIGN